jgi:uncharacterized membrane protein YqaE (UPF0057 family)
MNDEFSFRNNLAREAQNMLPVLAVFCPPVAVLLADRPSRAGLNLGLTLLLYVPGLLHALATVDRYEVNRRNQTVMRLAARYCS